MNKQLKTSAIILKADPGDHFFMVLLISGTHIKYSKFLLNKHLKHSFKKLTFEGGGAFIQEIELLLI